LTLSNGDLRASLADDWFAQVKTVQDMVRTRRKEPARPIRIATITTHGVDLMHTDFQRHAAFIRTNSTSLSGFFGDGHGFGSYDASVVLKTAPDVALYVAQTGDSRDGEDWKSVAERTAQVGVARLHHTDH